MDNTELKPFRIDVPDSELADLRERLRRTRYPEPLPDRGWSRGVPLAYLRELADYWAKQYDWRKHEAELNSHPQFTTQIDGTRIHFLHVRSPEPNALPLIASHGWPGSVVEFLKVIGPLSNPRAHGLDPSIAFDLVIPSLPGYGFSGPVPDVGWNVQRIAKAFAQLMRRLGYARYAAHGGDWGRAISRELGQVDREHVFGIHLTGIVGTPTGDDAKSDDPAVKRSLELQQRYQRDGSGYGYLQSTRPQTVGYALTDSAVGQLAWIVEKFKEWTESQDRPEDAIDRDQMLTNVMLYWLTRTAASSARLYVEGAAAWGKPEAPSTVPVGVSLFPYDLSYPVRRIAERNHHIVYWHELERGGHFPAMEEPNLLVAEIRACFQTIRPLTT